jgi:hypothetical protein
VNPVTVIGIDYPTLTCVNNSIVGFNINTQGGLDDMFIYFVLNILYLAFIEGIIIQNCSTGISIVTSGIIINDCRVYFNSYSGIIASNSIITITNSLILNNTTPSAVSGGGKQMSKK